MDLLVKWMHYFLHFSNNRNPIVGNMATLVGKVPAKYILVICIDFVGKMKHSRFITFIDQYQLILANSTIICYQIVLLLLK